jgi:hypothetical protein
MRGAQYEVFITHDPSNTCPSQAGPNVIAISTASQVTLAHTQPSEACPLMGAQVVRLPAVWVFNNTAPPVVRAGACGGRPCR